MPKKSSAKRAKEQKRLARETGDSLFFLMVPKPKFKNITDGTVPQTMFNPLAPKAAMLRYIRVKADISDKPFSATFIPTSHFRPLVKRLIKRGDIDPKDVRGSVEKLRNMTDKLLPEHPVYMPGEFRDAVIEQGEHLMPLVAIKERMGMCQHWSAVFTAMARNVFAGNEDIKIEIRGDPKFHESETSYLPGQGHVWPVVSIRSTGERIPVHTERPYLQANGKTTPAHPETRERILSGEFERYEEYAPEKPIDIPKGLKVDRPDVFGEP